MQTVVLPVKPEAPAMTVPATVAEIKASRKAKVEEVDVNRKLTAEEWKKIAKADKARQRAWAKEYRQQAEALRNETALAG